MDYTKDDATENLIETLYRCIDEVKALRENSTPSKSRALKYATAAGLPPQMAYSIAETAKYTGLDESVIRKEMKAGNLRAIMPAGKVRGYRITVEEVERWFKDHAEEQRRA